MKQFRKIREWQDAGLLDEATVERILNYENQRSTKQRLPLLLIIGGTFVVLAVFSFLAANWQAMPVGWKIGLVVVLMWSCYIVADLSERRHILHPIVFRIGGILAFGASILVVVQSFHLPMEGSLLGWCVFVAALVHYVLWRHEAYGVVAFLSGWTIFTSLGGFGQEQASYLDWTSFSLMIILSFSWFTSVNSCRRFYLAGCFFFSAVYPCLSSYHMTDSCGRFGRYFCLFQFSGLFVRNPIAVSSRWSIWSSLLSVRSSIYPFVRNQTSYYPP